MYHSNNKCKPYIERCYSREFPLRISSWEISKKILTARNLQKKFHSENLFVISPGGNMYLYIVPTYLEWKDKTEIRLFPKAIVPNDIIIVAHPKMSSFHNRTHIECLFSSTSARDFTARINNIISFHLRTNTHTRTLYGHVLYQLYVPMYRYNGRGRYYNIIIIRFI